MSPDARHAVTNPGHSTGPLTPEGKATAARNALKSGLFTACDFIRKGEETEYTQTLESLLRELSPEGALEETFATEIMGATWRLRRCRLIESTFDIVEEETLLEKRQKSVDRARAQSHNILRRSMAELRTLQTERKIRIELGVEEGGGLADSKKVLNAMKLHAAVVGSPENEDDPATHSPDSADGNIQEFEAMLRRELGFEPLSPLAGEFDPAAPGSFCKPAGSAQAVSSKIPRNAPCPCRSGLKYKKCCGGPAVQEAQKAA